MRKAARVAGDKNSSSFCHRDRLLLLLLPKQTTAPTLKCSQISAPRPDGEGEFFLWPNAGPIQMRSRTILEGKQRPHPPFPNAIHQNSGGDGGNCHSSICMRDEPDGHTLLVGNNGECAPPVLRSAKKVLGAWQGGRASVDPRSRVWVLLC